MLPPSGMGNFVALLPIMAKFPSFVTFTFGFSISPFLVFLFLLLSPPVHVFFFLPFSKMEVQIVKRGEITEHLILKKCMGKIRTLYCACAFKKKPVTL